jgi:hypothetical protein
MAFMLFMIVLFILFNIFYWATYLFRKKPTATSYL